MLQTRCGSCHSSGRGAAMGGLVVDTPNGLLKGGSRGPAVRPGHPEASLLIRAVSYADPSLKMPPAGPLAAGEVSLLREWIRSGTPAPSRSATGGNSAEARWAFAPLRHPVVPAPAPGRAPWARNWTHNPIDRFLLARMQQRGIVPNPSASRAVLIRRATFDLTGLPPTPEEVDAFLADHSPNAWEKVVDRLLASPAYGERWGRHWLDLARYADSDGYEADKDRPEAWPYRDFVIRALNEDLPFDTFVHWQLAGDEYAPDRPDAVAATGFLAAGPYVIPVPSDTEHNKLRYRYDDLDNMLSTTSSALLGLTVGCARCHDHKYDPIPTRDYYGMLAAFTTTERRVASLSRPQRELDRWTEREKTRLRNEKIDRLPLSAEDKRLLRLPSFFFFVSQVRLYQQYGKQVEVSDAELRDSLSPDRRGELERLEAAVHAAAPLPPGTPARALILTDTGAAPAESLLLRRGEVDENAERIQPRFLLVLQHGRSTEEYLRLAANAGPATTTRRRMALADWITDTRHGAGSLLARVIVNRLWQHHFGEGLVRTPGDFGAQGERPTNPELLDWLASALTTPTLEGSTQEKIRTSSKRSSSFILSPSSFSPPGFGWHLKPLHRLMLLSAAYRTSCDPPAQPDQGPENRLWARRRPLRLEAEALRDAALAVSGRLNGAMYGPPFRPRIPREAIATRSSDAYPTDIKESPDLFRRSIYAFVKRSVSQPLMEVFDAPEPTACCSRRSVTTVPTQALAVMNDPFVRQLADAFAARISREAGPDASAQVRRAYRVALGREPSPRELARSKAFLGSGGATALADFCHVILTLNEFAYVD